MTPLQTLSDDKRYSHMRKMARAYAVNWSWTAVTIYRGHRRAPPVDKQPVMTAVEKDDVGASLWARTASALRTLRSMHLKEPYPCLNLATMFVTRYASDGAVAIVESRIVLRIGSGFADARVFVGEEEGVDLVTIAINADASIVAVASQLILGPEEVRRRGRNRRS
jgi:hypothetical protein